MTDTVEQPVEQPNDVPNEPSVLGDQPVDTPAPVEQPAITSDSYDVADIENFDFAEFKGIEENKAFLDRAAAAGISNDQMKFILGEYNQIIPNVVGQMAGMQAETCKEALQAEWGAETQANIGAAMRAAQAAGLSSEEINNPALGNNPAVIKLLAHFGKQLDEDTPPQNTQPSAGEDVQQLMLSEAYSNPSHPDHKRVTDQVNRWYAKQYPDY